MLYPTQRSPHPGQAKALSYLRERVLQSRLVPAKPRDLQVPLQFTYAMIPIVVVQGMMCRLVSLVLTQLRCLTSKTLVVIVIQLPPESTSTVES